MTNLDNRVTRKRGLLIVVDSNEIRTLLRKGLEHFGFIVWTSATGTNALYRFRSRQDKIDAVLMDVNMPEWDGPNTLSALRGISPSLPCCFMWGGTGRYSDADLLGFGAHRVFLKPIELRTVAETFRNLLDPRARIETESVDPSREIRDVYEATAIPSMSSRLH